MRAGVAVRLEGTVVHAGDEAMCACEGQCRGMQPATPPLLSAIQGSGGNPRRIEYIINSSLILAKSRRIPWQTSPQTGLSAILLQKNDCRSLDTALRAQRRIVWTTRLYIVTVRRLLSTSAIRILPMSKVLSAPATQSNPLPMISSPLKHILLHLATPYNKIGGRPWN